MRITKITGDKALIDGHYYSEKAPAIVLMALPAFSLTVLTQKLMESIPTAPRAGVCLSGWRPPASVGLLAALGGVAFFALLGAAVGRADRAGGDLRSIPWLVDVSVCDGDVRARRHDRAALHRAVGRARPHGRATRLHRGAVRGAGRGLGVSRHHSRARRWDSISHTPDLPRAWRFGLALMPGAILILANNYLIGGSPFQVSYGSNPAFPEITSGNAFGFNLPDPEAVAELLWGEYRGLFFWCPVLLMAIPGLVILFRKHPPVAWMIAVVFVLMMIQVASFYSWYGGNAVGPRYLSPALPFLGLAAAYGIKRFPIPGVALALLSVVLMAMVSAVAIDPPQDVLTPLRSFYLVRVRDDRFAENLGTLLGANLRWSLLALAASRCRVSGMVDG